MGPGDRIRCDETIHRVCRVLDKENELAAIAEHARRVQDWVAGFAEREPEVREGLVERFRDYMVERWRETKDKLPQVRRNVIAYHLLGSQQQRFYFDFSKPDDEILQWGEPERYDMRYTYPASGLQRLLDGEIDWDQLHFTNDVSVHQVTYAREFYALLRSEMLDL